MLKKFMINGKRIPVPIPIMNLGEAMQWVQKHLVRPDHVITRVQLNGQDVDLGPEGDVLSPSVAFDENSDLRCKIDSPQEICLQTIDALRNLSSVIGRNLKPVAVQLWEHKGLKAPIETAAVLDDIGLMQELLESVLLLLDKRIDATNILVFQSALSKGINALQFAVQQADWKGSAKVLLNQLESPALELASELSSIEKVIFEIQADRTLTARRPAPSAGL